MLTSPLNNTLILSTQLMALYTMIILHFSYISFKKFPKLDIIIIIL